MSHTSDEEVKARKETLADLNQTIAEFAAHDERYKQQRRIRELQKRLAPKN